MVLAASKISHIYAANARQFTATTLLGLRSALRCCSRQHEERKKRSSRVRHSLCPDHFQGTRASRSPYNYVKMCGPPSQSRMSFPFLATYDLSHIYLILYEYASFHESSICFLCSAFATRDLGRHLSFPRPTFCSLWKLIFAFLCGCKGLRGFIGCIPR